MIRTMQCTSGEKCYSEECNYSQVCMHPDEATTPFPIDHPQSEREIPTDTDRLDWLERNRLIASIVWRYVDGTFTLRMATDFAMTLNIVSGTAMRDEWLIRSGVKSELLKGGYNLSLARTELQDADIDEDCR